MVVYLPNDRDENKICRDVLSKYWTNIIYQNKYYFGEHAYIPDSDKELYEREVRYKIREHKISEILK